MRSSGNSIRWIAQEMELSRNVVAGVCGGDGIKPTVTRPRPEAKGRSPRGKVKPKDRPFLCFDGEGNQDGYWLLGNEHEYIYKVGGLSTLDCLEFLTKGESDGTIRIFYGLHYDINQIARDLSRAKQNDLFRGGWVEHRGYSLRYYPHHRLEICRPGRRWIFDDVANYFHAPLIDVAEKMGIEVHSIVREGKASRANLKEWIEEDLFTYTRQECILTRLVMEHFRQALQWPADDVLHAIKPTSWMGPGSVASALLRKLPDFRPAREYRGGGMSEAWAGGYPTEVQDACERAFFGGRIELYQIGHVGPVYIYDLHSAYPAAMRSLWTGGRWRKVTPGARSIKSDYVLSEIEWDLTGTNATIGPFPWRDKNGEVSYPAIGRGWYWWPEVSHAILHHRVKILSWYWLDQTQLSPLSNIVERLYQLRQQFRAQGDPRELGVKACLVALYGKLCQRFGDARWRNLAMAGWVTASIRATMLRAMMQAPDKIIACLTDSIHSTVPLDLDVGDGLGQWSERRVEWGEYLLSSIYRLAGDAKSAAEERTGGLQVSGLNWETVLYQIEQKGKVDVYTSMFVSHLTANSSRIYNPHRLKILRPSDETKVNKRTLDPFGASRREVERPKHPKLKERSYPTFPCYSLPGEDAHTIVPSYPSGSYDERFEDEEAEEVANYEFD